MNYTTPLSKLADKLRIKRNLMNHVNAVDATCIAANQRIEQLEHKLSSTIAAAIAMAQEIQELAAESENEQGIELVSSKAIVDLWEVLYQEQNLIDEVTL